jgi:exodeoxyribonuclease VII small subunit
MAKTGTGSDFSGFEKEFEHLGEIVERLESGNIPLEEMLRLYEEGTLLASKLAETLKKAELKVQTLSKVHEELATFETSPFDEQE